MKDLTQGDETRGLVAFAIPMLLGNVFQQFYNMVDSFVVGRFVGTTALAAVGTSFPIVFLMLALIMGVSMGSTVLISQFFGARDKEKIRCVVDTSYVFFFWSGIAFTIIGTLAAVPILKLLNVPDEIMGEATTYLRIIFLGMLATFGYNGVSGILRGLGDSKTPLYLLIAATLLNIVLDLVFVIVFKWGVAGVAWATLLAQAASFIGVMIVLDKRDKYARIDFTSLHFDRHMFGRILKIGLPAGIQQTLVSIGMLALTSIVNSFGAIVMAGFTAAGRIDSFAAMPAMNLSQAITTFTGQNIGAGKTERVRKGHLSALAVGLSISLFMTVIVVLFGASLMRIFTENPEVIEAGREYLVIVGLFYFSFTIMFINNGVMRGAGDVFIPLLTTLLAMWLVRIPCAILFTRVFNMGPAGIWWSIPAGWMVGTIFTTLYYRSGKWKSKALVKKTLVAVEEPWR